MSKRQATSDTDNKQPTPDNQQQTTTSNRYIRQTKQTRQQKRVKLEAKIRRFWRKLAKSPHFFCF